jgi:toxin ParE1/3/4
LKHARSTELAESDLVKIWLCIARDNPDAADQFIDKLRLQSQRLATTPQRGRPRSEFAVDLRSYRVGNYFIFYFRD